MHVTRERHRARWDENSESELRARVAAGEFVPAIARAMGRSQEAVRTRANILGIPIRFAAQRVSCREAERPRMQIGSWDRPTANVSG